MKKRFFIFCGIILGTIVVANLWSKSSNRNKIELYIGVPLANNEEYRYDILEEKLESKFDVDIKFIDLYKNIDLDDTEQDLMTDIDTILYKNQVDMILGIPPHQLEYAIANDSFLDITNTILNKEDIHKGTLNKSEKMGGGKLYYISPTINHISFVIQNEELLSNLNVSLLPDYASWDDFLKKLDEVQNQIDQINHKDFPLALSVKNTNEDILFSAYDFETQAFGLDSKAFKGNGLSIRWKEFYKIFSEIIYKYGIDLKDMENGKFPKNFIFTNGNYGFLIADSYDIETLLNENFNKVQNETAPTKLEMKFPVTISCLSYDGSKLQNFRDSSIAIDKESANKNICIDILNYLLSKDYALEMINSREKYCHFSNSLMSYPSYFDEETIEALNQLYGGKFDAHMIYDVEYGSVIYNINQTNNGELFDDILNNGFTMVYDSRKTKSLDANDSINKSLEFIEREMRKIH